MNFKYINSWTQSLETFKQQLNRNLYELNNNYPPHWKHFIQKLQSNSKIKTIIDVGCGIGSLYALTNKHFPHIKYIGFDYSKNAIDLAKKTWNHNGFYVKSYQDLQPQLFKDQKTLLVANALADILPNGDECIKTLLNLNSKYIQLLRVKTTDKLSYFEIYDAYDIKTYAFYHNYNNLIQIIKHSQYKIFVDDYSSNIKDVFLIKEKNNEI